MEEIEVLTVPQNPDESQLMAIIYQDKKGKFHLSLDSSDPNIPRFVPLQISATNLAEAKEMSEKMLYITRDLFRHALGKSPGPLPDSLKPFGDEIPAFIQFLGKNEINDFFGEN
jgi:hypothetical protein